ncbi:STAS domain-containing protein [Amycolatopsis sp. CA-230715]|uniref:STAS domain-containing protein n=1 Tax=Amycolatopsis sp. CA-230715 TaxID=2745196 RepID=UPI001C037ED9|nr:STAS domain-containing protein [Amycolatopsis sp. CA-230715]QWF77799.1 hypothetical protein HUW46_01192 [Amycolatopsis sp. CA-230715]
MTSRGHREVLRIVSHPVTDSVAEIVLTGEIDLSTAPRLDACVDALFRGPMPKVVVVDMNGVGFLGSAGMASLLRAQEQARSYDVPLLLCAVRAQVRRSLVLIGLDGEFVFRDSVEEAKTDWAGTAS